MAQNKKRAQEQAATLVFVDEAGFSLIPPVRKTWSPRGCTPIVRHRMSKHKLNSISAIACKPDGSDCDVLFYMQPENVESESIIDFLSVLHAEIPGRIVLLWDNLSAHRSGVVKEHIRTQSEWLTVEHFPTYAPELNPVEYLFGALTNKDIANYGPDSIADIADRLEEAADRIAQDQQIIQGFLKASGLFDIQDASSLLEPQRLVA